MNYEVTWISDNFGINIKINPSKRSINALKKFIDVLETDLEEDDAPKDS